MKKTILMLAMVGVALAACEKKDEPYQFKATEEIYLNGVEQPRFKSTTTQYTLAEIVRHPNIAVLFRNTVAGQEGVFYRHFSEARMRDTINNRLLMLATDVLTEDGRLVYDFIGATDLHLRFLVGDNLNGVGDTVGYIPQSVIDNARVHIEELYAQERFDEIYELFHTAFTFYTCTGEEYRQIVANGGN